MGDVGEKAAFEIVQSLKPFGLQLIFSLKQPAFPQRKIRLLLGHFLLPFAVGQAQGENQEFHDCGYFEVKDRERCFGHPRMQGQQEPKTDDGNARRDEKTLGVFSFEKGVNEDEFRNGDQCNIDQNRRRIAKRV